MLKINRSAYSYWLNMGRKAEDERVVFYQKIIEIYADSNGIYGSPKITKIINRQGIKCSTSTVARSMKRLGIKSISTEKFPYKRSSLTLEEKKLIVNLIKDLDVTKINQVWTTDISYINTIDEGNYYLISYIDYFSKKVVAWNLTKRQKAEDMVLVLKEALKKRNPHAGLIIHSDKGAQMRSNSYRDYLSMHHLIPSYTSINHSCDENAAQEAFHALIKKECLYHKKLHNFNEAYSAIYNYIENFYNPVRIHSSIGYLSPVFFESIL